MATSIEDLIEHLIEHPEDHDVRWRLCKKLYAKREYEEVLPHLEQLKEDWKPKRNLDRYLAATYYRLKMYGQSIEVLERAVERWPQESGLREQLARMFEAAGDREAAAREWEVMYRIDPTRDSAASAIERLRQPTKEGEESDLPDAEPLSDITIICPECNAKNSPDFEACWRCKSLLTLSPTPTPIEFLSSDDLPPPSTARLFVGGLLSVAILAGAVYVTLRYVVPPAVFGTGGAAGENFTDAVHLNLAIARAIAGAVALVVAPLCLWLGIKIARVRKLPVGQPWTIGVFMAGALYLGQWPPLPYAPIAVGVALVIALFAPLYALQANLLPRIVISLSAFTLTVAAAGSAFVAIAGIEPYTDQEAAQIVRANALAPLERSPRKATTPYTMEHRFTSTGSPWLDEQAGVVRFDIVATADSANLNIEYRDAGNTVIASEQVSGKSGSIAARIQPGVAYRLVVFSQQRFEITVNVVSAMHIVYSR